MSVVFKNSPINEVVVSSYFNPPLSGFRSEHVGLFWEKIKEEFPVVHQQLPVEIGPNMAIGPDMANGEFFPMPRYWFLADDDITLIQVQKNAFMLNWRRRNDNEYPRFHQDIKPAFDKYYSMFEEFIRSAVNIDTLPIDLYELAYINTVERCEFWEGPQDTKNIIPSFSIPSSGIDIAGYPEFDCQYSYGIEEDLQLNIKIRNGVIIQQPDAPVLIFEIRARARLGQVAKSEADKWFKRAHDSIIRCFVGITNRDIQNRYWNAIEEMQ